MANADHVQLVLQGSKALNLWREANPDVVLDLSNANLSRADFVHANLNNAILCNTKLKWADFRWADMIGADLSGAQLIRSDFHKADLEGAKFCNADFSDANFEDANMRTADLTGTIFAHTRLLNTDLATAKGLQEVDHRAPSVLDFETISKSGYLPSEFLCGCGLHDAAIKAALSDNDKVLAESLEQPGNYYSCFISHSTRDEAFVSRLHADLQAGGVRCWYAPHDLRIGERLLDALYSAIRKQEKLLLVLSEDSVSSEWVRDEVEKAFAEERDRNGTVVFPIRVDDSVMNTDMAWAEKIRVGRHIGDFRQWSDEGSYGKALERLFRDLRRNEEK